MSRPALLGALLVLTGCETLPSLRPAQNADPTELIQYGNSVRTLDAEALEARYSSAYSEHASDPSADSAVRLALLLGYPSAPFYDPEAARELLSSAATDQGAPRGTSEFATLLDEFLSERNCVAGDPAALVDLFVQERQRSLALSEELADARAALASERQLRQNLQGQLDALKALEERLNADPLRQ